MQFGIFYEHQLPKPWTEDDEFCLLRGRARPGRARRPPRVRLRVGGRAPLPRRVLALLRARGVPRRGGRPHGAHPARPRHPPGDPEVQPPGAHRRGAGHARPDLGRAGRLRDRRGRHPPRAARLRDPRQAEAGDGARGRRADRQHDGARPVPRLHVGDVLDAVPQRAAQAAPEAAPADVDGVHEPRHDQGRRPQRHRGAGVQLRRSRRGQVVGRRLLRHHPQRGVRAARPHRQRQHRPRHRILAARGPGRGDPARAGGVRVLRLCSQCARRARPDSGAHHAVGRVPGAPLPRHHRAQDRCRQRTGRHVRQLHRHARRTHRGTCGRCSTSASTR